MTSTKSGLLFREALIDSSMNNQSTKKVKCDFTFFFIFNGLSATKNGSTSMCCGNSELIRVSLGKLFFNSGLRLTLWLGECE